MKRYLSAIFVALLTAVSVFAQDKPVSVDKLFVSGGNFVVNNNIDVLLLESLRGNDIEPSPICSDVVFIRRIFFDLIGTLPTSAEIQPFLKDKSPNKRTALVDKLLAREEFVDYRTMKWCDLLRVKAEYPINLWPNGALCYHNWIREAVRTNKPYNVFARELLLSSGSNFRDGAANFYRAVQAKDAETLAETVALTFLGQRTMPWTDIRRAQLATFFSRVAYKETAEWKEEIVYWNREPLADNNVTFPDGSTAVVPPNTDPRQVFADWLVSPKNKDFNRYIANRIWFWMFGRGIVNEPDDFGENNPPVHPALLDYLADELVKSNYDMKRLYRLIACSSAYQQSSLARKDNERAETLFAVYQIRRLEAEVLQDAITQIFGSASGYHSEVPEPFTNVPRRYRSIMLPDASVTSSFLEMFGRPTRDTGMESDRNNNVTESQQLFMINSTELNDMAKNLARGYRNRLNGRNQNERVALLYDLWFRILSRPPSVEELQDVSKFFQNKSRSADQAFQDVIWTLVNTKEFQCRH